VSIDRDAIELLGPLRAPSLAVAAAEIALSLPIIEEHRDKFIVAWDEHFGQ
jgi:hypothetical protein